MAFCFRCGNQMADGMPVCPHCGAPVAAEQQYGGQQDSWGQPQDQPSPYGQPQQYDQQNFAICYMK
ncbi:MAG: zinc ribbon domain-containing protein [Eubacterium sp.]|nr:zinc ribbon domain-containing protein [Eubacterium sp.]